MKSLYNLRRFFKISNSWHVCVFVNILCEARCCDATHFLIAPIVDALWFRNRIWLCVCLLCCLIWTYMYINDVVFAFCSFGVECNVACFVDSRYGLKHLSCYEICNNFTVLINSIYWQMRTQPVPVMRCRTVARLLFNIEHKHMVSKHLYIA